MAVSVYAPDYAPPTRDELAEAVTHMTATLRRLRAAGVDGPTLWAHEVRRDALLEQWAQASG